MARLALLLVVLAAVVAATAGAAQAGATATVFEAPRPAGWKRAPWFVGPALAGDQVAWAVRTRAGYDVYTANHDGSSRVRRRVAVPFGRSDAEFSPGVASIAASPDRIAVVLSSWTCNPRLDRCGRDPPRLQYHAALASQPGKPLQWLAGCRTPTACDTASCPPFPGPVDVSGQVVAYRAGCQPGPRVRDLAPGADPPGRTVTAPPFGFRVADPYLAHKGYDDAGTSHVRVIDWRSDVERYRVPGGFVGDLDVQSDGDVVFVERDFSSDDENNDTSLRWASEADPQPHVLDTAAGIDEPRVTADRVAYLRVKPEVRRDLFDLIVRSLDGPVIASTPTRGLLDVLDFDGAQLAWAEAPCVKISITVWDLEGEPPALPSAKCRFPSLARRELKGAKRLLPLPLRCPASATEGCRADAEVVGRGLGLTYRRSVEVAAGHRRTAKLWLARSAVCALDRSEVSARVVFTRSRPHRESRREVRVDLDRARAHMCDDD